VKAFYCSIKLIFLTWAYSSIIILLATNAIAIPLSVAYETVQYELQISKDFDSRNGALSVFHSSLHPGSNDKINEEHPIPEYIKKISKKQPFPIFYQQLLEIEPVDQVQSKVFDETAFRSIQRIGVLGFENKTVDPFKDENAGHVVAKQVSRELQTLKNYSIIPPLMENEDARIRIVTQVNGTKSRKLPQQKNQLTFPALSNSNKNENVDAVMIGAVTKYMNSYRDRRGGMKKSLSSKVEFGSFLVSTVTGQVIWGSRFIGTQPTGLVSSGSKWLSKKQLSQRAMKKVLRAFHENSKNLN
jgi:hypothetical protein